MAGNLFDDPADLVDDAVALFDGPVPITPPPPPPPIDPVPPTTPLDGVQWGPQLVFQIEQRYHICGLAPGHAGDHICWKHGDHEANPGAPAAVRQILTGVAVNGTRANYTAWTAALDSFDTAAGKRPVLVQWYIPWSVPEVFPVSECDFVTARGQIPFITWESWDWLLPATDPSQQQYADRFIIAGNFDSYISTWAAGAKAYGKQVVVRVLSEANGNGWNPWHVGIWGNTADELKGAWGHIWNIFQSVGATNVYWVWSANNNFDGSTAIASIYPGDSQVDAVGIDGYNFGDTTPPQVWTTYHQTFDSTLAEFSAVTSRPVWITEVGSAETPLSKSAWITDALNNVVADQRIAAWMWFNYNKEADWRIESSVGATAAYASGMANAAFEHGGP